VFFILKTPFSSRDQHADQMTPQRGDKNFFIAGKNAILPHLLRKIQRFLKKQLSAPPP